MKHAALLRGINVGGKNILPMKDLSSMFVAAGCRDVVTYIQSGNVVFTAPPAVLKKLPQTISKSIADKFGLKVPVLIRSHAELAAVIRNSPYFEPGQEQLLYIAFLAHHPEAAAIEILDPDRSPPDRFQVIGQEIHLCLRNGAGKTKLTNAWMDSRLSTTSTARNWATLLRLHDMTRD